MIPVVEHIMRHEARVMFDKSRYFKLFSRLLKVQRFVTNRSLEFVFSIMTVSDYLSFVYTCISICTRASGWKWRHSLAPVPGSWKLHLPAEHFQLLDFSNAWIKDHWIFPIWVFFSRLLVLLTYSTLIIFTVHPFCNFLYLTYFLSQPSWLRRVRLVSQSLPW